MKIKSLFFFGLIALKALAQEVPAYYSSIDINSNGEVLKQQLTTLLKNTHHTQLTYTPGVWQVLKSADVDPNNPDSVLLLYGWDDTDTYMPNDRTRDRNATCHTSNCTGKWVREHVFPRSKGNPNLGFEGAGADAHHLRAIDYERNSLRSNYRFVENTNGANGNSKVISPSLFYPGDEWKGDVARMVMYMYVRYETQCMPVNVAAGSISFSPMRDMPDVLLKWNAEDPVSDFERNRNEVIFGAQGNRNPFIDNPFLATKIWGGPLAEDKWDILSNANKENLEIKIYPNPVSEDFYLSGLDAISQYQVHILDTKGVVVEQFYNTNSINISNYPSGVYFVKLTYDSITTFYKIVKK